MTSDITKGNIKLRLFADVYPVDEPAAPVTIEPATVEFSRDVASPHSTVLVTNTSDVPLTLKLVNAPGGDFIVNYSDKPIKPGTSAKLTIKAVNGYEPRLTKKSFTFELNDAKRTRITIPVRTVKPKAKVLQQSGTK